MNNLVDELAHNTHHYLDRSNDVSLMKETEQSSMPITNPPSEIINENKTFSDLQDVSLVKHEVDATKMDPNVSQVNGDANTYNQYTNPDSNDLESQCEILSDQKKASASKHNFKIINRKQKATFNHPYGQDKKQSKKKKTEKIDKKNSKNIMIVNEITKNRLQLRKQSAGGTQKQKPDKTYSQIYENLKDEYIQNQLLTEKRKSDMKPKRPQSRQRVQSAKPKPRYQLHQPHNANTQPNTQYQSKQGFLQCDLNQKQQKVPFVKLEAIKSQDNVYNMDIVDDTSAPGKVSGMDQICDNQSNVDQMNLPDSFIMKRQGLQSSQSPYKKQRYIQNNKKPEKQNSKSKMSLNLPNDKFLSRQTRQRLHGQQINDDLADIMIPKKASANKNFDLATPKKQSQASIHKATLGSEHNSLSNMEPKAPNTDAKAVNLRAKLTKLVPCVSTAVDEIEIQRRLRSIISTQINPPLLINRNSQEMEHDAQHQLMQRGLEQYNFVNASQNYRQRSTTQLHHNTHSNTLPANHTTSNYRYQPRKVKQYLYFVYKGNYPNFIEDALEKRGVWKKFDIQAHYQKIHEMQALNNNQVGVNGQKGVTPGGSASQYLKLGGDASQMSMQNKQYDHQLNVQNVINAYPSCKDMTMNNAVEPQQEMVHDISQMQILQTKAMININKFEEELIAKNKQIMLQKEESSGDNMENNHADIEVNQMKKDTNYLDGVTQMSIDAAVISKVNFIWKPFNFYDKATQKNIDKRMLKSYTYSPLIYNHFENLKAIATKSGLIKSLKQYYFHNQQAKNQGYVEFDTTPTTFLVQSGVNDDRMNDLIARYRQLQKGFAPKERLPLKHCINNIWLVKPTNLNQGRGIEIFSNLDKMLKFINSRSIGHLCVVQKYIERPLLYKQRKFDIRIWALMNTKNEIYFYREGYLRTSSSEYKLDDNNQYVHLTNQCLQVKNSEEYGQHEEGNTLSFKEFQDYLDSEEFLKSRPDFNRRTGFRCVIERDFIPRMKDIVIDSFCAVKSLVNPNHRKSQFEFFGYDFMIDEDFRVWLIEINSNPYIGTPNKYMKELVPKMIDEMFQIVLDPCYPPIDSFKKSLNAKKSSFELIYQESQMNSSSHIPKDQVTKFDVHQQQHLLINQRRPYSSQLLYPFDFNKYERNSCHMSRGGKIIQMIMGQEHRIMSPYRNDVKGSWHKSMKQKQVSEALQLSNGKDKRLQKQQLSPQNTNVSISKKAYHDMLVLATNEINKGDPKSSARSQTKSIGDGKTQTPGQNQSKRRSNTMHRYQSSQIQRLKNDYEFEKQASNTQKYKTRKNTKNNIVNVVSRPFRTEYMKKQLIKQQHQLTKHADIQKNGGTSAMTTQGKDAQNKSVIEKQLERNQTPLFVPSSQMSIDKVETPIENIKLVPSAANKRQSLYIHQQVDEQREQNHSQVELNNSISPSQKAVSEIKRRDLTPLLNENRHSKSMNLNTNQMNKQHLINQDGSGVLTDGVNLNEQFVYIEQNEEDIEEIDDEVQHINQNFGEDMLDRQDASIPRCDTPSRLRMIDDNSSQSSPYHSERSNQNVAIIDDFQSSYQSAQEMIVNFNPNQNQIPNTSQIQQYDSNHQQVNSKRQSLIQKAINEKNIILEAQEINIDEQLMNVHSPKLANPQQIKSPQSPKSQKSSKCKQTNGDENKKQALPQQPPTAVDCKQHKNQLNQILNTISTVEKETKTNIMNLGQQRSPGKVQNPVAKSHNQLAPSKDKKGNLYSGIHEAIQPKAQPVNYQKSAKIIKNLQKSGTGLEVWNQNCVFEQLCGRMQNYIIQKHKKCTDKFEDIFVDVYSKLKFKKKQMDKNLNPNKRANNLEDIQNIDRVASRLQLFLFSEKNQDIKKMSQMNILIDLVKCLNLQQFFSIRRVIIDHLLKVMEGSTHVDYRQNFINQHIAAGQKGLKSMKNNMGQSSSTNIIDQVQSENDSLDIISLIQIHQNEILAEKHFSLGNIQSFPIHKDYGRNSVQSSIKSNKSKKDKFTSEIKVKIEKLFLFLITNNDQKPITQKSKNFILPNLIRTGIIAYLLSSNCADESYQQVLKKLNSFEIYQIKTITTPNLVTSKEQNAILNVILTYVNFTEVMQKLEKQLNSINGQGQKASHKKLIRPKQKLQQDNVNANIHNGQPDIAHNYFVKHLNVEEEDEHNKQTNKPDQQQPPMIISAFSNQNQINEYVQEQALKNRSSYPGGANTQSGIYSPKSPKVNLMQNSDIESFLMNNEDYQYKFLQKMNNQQYDFKNEEDSDGDGMMMPLPIDSQSDLADKIQVANQTNVHFLTKNNAPLSAEGKDATYLSNGQISGVYNSSSPLKAQAQLDAGRSSLSIKYAKYESKESHQKNLNQVYKLQQNQIKFQRQQQYAITQSKSNVSQQYQRSDSRQSNGLFETNKNSQVIMNQERSQQIQTDNRTQINDLLNSRTPQIMSQKALEIIQKNTKRYIEGQYNQQRISNSVQRGSNISQMKVMNPPDQLDQYQQASVAVPMNSYQIGFHKFIQAIPSTDVDKPGITQSQFQQKNKKLEAQQSKYSQNLKKFINTQDPNAKTGSEMRNTNMNYQSYTALRQRNQMSTQKTPKSKLNHQPIQSSQDKYPQIEHDRIGSITSLSLLPTGQEINDQERRLAYRGSQDDVKKYLQNIVKHNNQIIQSAEKQAYNIRDSLDGQIVENLKLHIPSPTNLQHNIHVNNFIQNSFNENQQIQSSNMPQVREDEVRMSQQYSVIQDVKDLIQNDMSGKAHQKGQRRQNELYNSTQLRYRPTTLTFHQNGN